MKGIKNEEVMVLCKKVLPYSKFEKGKWYRASMQFATNEEKLYFGWRSSYWVYLDLDISSRNNWRHDINGGRFYETKEQLGDNLYSEYFYTNNELRKEKLKKLNKKKFLI